MEKLSLSPQVESAKLCLSATLQVGGSFDLLSRWLGAGAARWTVSSEQGGNFKHVSNYQQMVLLEFGEIFEVIGDVWICLNCPASYAKLCI